MKFEIINNEHLYFLDKGDELIIKEFNKKEGVNEKFKIHTELLPEPFIGNLRSAKVYFFALNPGFVGGNDGENYWHKQEKFKKLIFDNIKGKEKDVEYPYYYLNEDKEFEKSPGHKWAKQKFRWLWSEENGIDKKEVSKKFCTIQFHGYHSNMFKELGEILPSQKIMFSFVKEELIKKEPIIVMRSEKLWNKWCEKVKQLEGYPKDKKIILRNYRNPTISRKNMMNEKDFDKIINALKS